MRKDLGLRWIVFFIGLLIVGLGIALTVKGQRFGVGSWDVLHIGLFKQIGLSIGLWSIIMGILIVMGASIGLRQWPKIGTIANMVSVGLFIDFFNWIIPDPDTFLMQFILFILGVFIMATGVGIYISGDVGAGPRDTLMLLLVEKLNWSITIARTTMEIAVAIIGFLLGGPIGVGTFVIAFALGPIIQISLGHSQKFIEKHGEGYPASSAS